MSIRWRITLLATASALLVILVAGFAIVRVHERLLIRNLDETLEQKAVENLAALETGPDPVISLQPPGDEDSLAQLVTNGRVVAMEPETVGPEDRTVDTALGEPPPPGRRWVIRQVSGLVPGEGDYRVLSAGAGEDSTLHLALPLDDTRDSAMALRGALAVAAPLTALALGALIWWFVGRTLSPVEAIRAEVGTIGGADLHRRVPEPATDDEVGRLARTMNAMLDRLEASAQQQRRFVDDASHELRSPLTRMRTELEVDLADPNAADLSATHRSALEEVVGLQRLVDDLLHLARRDSGAPDSAADPRAVDLDDLVLRAAHQTRELKTVRVDTTAVGAAQVVGDPAQLGRMVTNLTENAVRHARSAISFELREVDGSALLAVSDDGPGVPATDRERIFERFARLDTARGSGTGGAGLGLAIVQEVVTEHGGRVWVEDHRDGGARFVVDFGGAEAP